jgi:hypothetical protein
MSMLFFLKEQLAAPQIIIPYVAGMAFITGLLLWNIYKWQVRKPIYFSKAMLIAALVWTRMPYWQWLVFVFAALALLEHQAKHAMEIGFSSGEIVFNSLFKKRFKWSELSNVVLKDGLLTVDFKNNRLFQKEIDDGEQEASEEEFNQWCREQLLLSGNPSNPVRN